MDRPYHALAKNANRSGSLEPRQIAAVSLSNGYGISLPYARLVADIQGYRIREAWS